MWELRTPSTNARPTAHPRIMDAADLHLECLKPFFDQVSVGIITPTAES